jgi:hypothetical protein
MGDVELFVMIPDTSPKYWPLVPGTGVLATLAVMVGTPEMQGMVVLVVVVLVVVEGVASGSPVDPKSGGVAELGGSLPIDCVTGLVVGLAGSGTTVFATGPELLPPSASTFLSDTTQPASNSFSL